jgi:hypothetical protein
MSEFLLFAVVVLYLAICYGRGGSETGSNRQRRQNWRFWRATAKKQNDGVSSR